jgi:hypothetical protein
MASAVTGSSWVRLFSPWDDARDGSYWSLGAVRTFDTLVSELRLSFLQIRGQFEDAESIVEEHT